MGDVCRDELLWLQKERKLKIIFCRKVAIFRGHMITRLQILTTGALGPSSLISTRVQLSRPKTSPRSILQLSVPGLRFSKTNTNHFAWLRWRGALEQESELHFQCGSARGFECSLDFFVVTKPLDHLPVSFAADTVECPQWPRAMADPCMLEPLAVGRCLT